jgi:hypothetical protein
MAFTLCRDGMFFMVASSFNFSKFSFGDAWPMWWPLLDVRNAKMFWMQKLLDAVNAPDDVRSMWLQPQRNLDFPIAVVRKKNVCAVRHFTHSFCLVSFTCGFCFTLM